MKSLPILLKNPNILLIGAGKVAFQKAKVLKNNFIDFKIIAKDISEDIKKLNLNIKNKKVVIDDLDNFNIIIDASGNKEVKDILLLEKNKRFLFLNIVDEPKYCDFYFSSLLQYGKLKIAISSDGASPKTTQFIRDKIETVIPNNIDNFLDIKQIERENKIIDTESTKRELAQLNKGKVYLIGCGTGDVELLTLKAYKLIKTLDILFTDYLIGEEILKIIPKTTQIITVGKKKGFHSVKQDDINKLLLEYAKKGINIGRLKSGDPYIFGRGSEEAEFLIKKNISVEIVSGISSSIVAPTSAGIPVTARGYASGVSIVSAHLQGNKINLDWINLLKMENHTVVVLMGLSRVKEIVKKALEIAINKNKLVAIISNATRQNQKIVTSTIENLIYISKNIERPAILVFGDVVKLSTILPNYINRKKVV